MRGHKCEGARGAAVGVTCSQRFSKFTRRLLASFVRARHRAAFVPPRLSDAILSKLSSRIALARVPYSVHVYAMREGWMNEVFILMYIFIYRVCGLETS